VYWNDTNNFPYSLFSWIGIDGTSIPSITFAHSKDGYNSSFSIGQLLEQWENWDEKDAPMLCSFGYGDGGGGPTEEMLVQAKIVDKLPLLPRVKFESKSLEENYEAYFQKTCNKWRGELYAEFHRGVLTSHTKIKMLNRKAELALREAELWSTVLRMQEKVAEKPDFERLWKAVLKNQFHDVLPGSAINEVYITAHKELGDIILRANEIAHGCMKRLAESVESGPILFNSLSWPREEYVTVPSKVGKSNVQEVEGGFLTKVRIPSIGFTTLTKDLGSNSAESQVTINEEGGGVLIENKFLKVRMSKGDGAIESIYDKEAHREILRAKSNLFVFYENIPGWADAWDIEKGYKLTSFEAPPLEDFKIVEHGPLRATIKAKRQEFRHSRIMQLISLYADSRRIDFVTTTEMHDKELLLKVWFHFDLNSDKATFDIPFGNVDRKTTTNTSWEQAQFEVPMQKWVDISESDYGVSILNDGRYGVAAENSSLGISVVKTPIYPDYAADSVAQSTFTFSLLPHKGEWKEALVPQRAYELNVPIRIIDSSSIGRNDLSEKITNTTFINIDSPNLMLESVKISEEDDEEIIIRLCEIHNKRGVAQVTFWKKINDVKCLDLLELSEVKKNIEIAENKALIPYHNFEILTVKSRLEQQQTGIM
jgi:alpha-mannosidase